MLVIQWLVKKKHIEKEKRKTEKKKFGGYLSAKHSRVAQPPPSDRNGGDFTTSRGQINGRATPKWAMGVAFFFFIVFKIGSILGIQQVDLGHCGDAHT